MANKTTTFTINIDARIQDIVSKMNTVKGVVQNTFNASNLGQSLQGNFNALEKIMKRIKNTTTSPIRSEWGVETLLADFKRAGLEVDEVRKKIESFQNAATLKDKVVILGKEQVKAVEDIDKILTSINTKEEQRLKTEEKIAELKKESYNITRRKGYKESTTKLANAQEEYNALAEAQKAAEEKLSNLGSSFTLTKTKSRIKGTALNSEKILDKFKGFYSATGDYKSNLTQLFGEGWEKRSGLIDQETGLLKLGMGNGSIGQKLKQELTNGDFPNEKIQEAITLFQELIKQKNEYLSATTDKANADAALGASTEKIKNIKNDLKPALDRLKEIQTELTELEKKKNIKVLPDNMVEQLKEVAKNAGYSEEEIQKLVNGLGDNPSVEQFKQALEGINVELGEKATASYENATNGVELYDAALREANADVNAQYESEKRLNDQMRDVNAITNRIKMFTGFYGIMNMIRRSINSAISTIKELDEQMTKMAVVTSPTISDYWKQLPQYTKRANALGAAIKEVYEADTLYYQQGLKTNQVIAVSNETMKMARIAALDAAEATDRMTSAMRGFNMEINETSAQRVNDVYSQLAAITASDVNEISVAMTKTASIAHSAGMEFETTAAFLSQIIETTRESADTAGTALKTIIARFEELKKSPTEIGEVDGEVVDANKIETALRSVGIALRDTQGQFRDLDDVFLELSGKWDSLDKNTQRYIATIAAGSRQQSRFIAMMQNYAHTVDLVAQANGSAGASQKQFEKTLDSMKTKLNALRNAWDTFAMGIMNSDLLKGAVTIGTTFVDLLNKIGKAADAMNVSLLGSAARVGLLIAGLRTLGAVSRKLIPYLTGKGSLGNIIGKNTLVANSADANQKMGILQALANRGAIRKQQKMFGNQGVGGVRLLQNADKSASNIGSGLAATLPKLGKALLIIAAIAAVVGTIYTIVKGIKFNSQEEKFKRDREALDNYKKSASELKDKLDQVNNSKEDYKSMQKELDNLVIGTDEWKEKLAEVNKEILDLLQSYPELVKYTSKNMFGAFEIDSKGFDELLKKQEKAYYNAQKATLKQQIKVNRNTQIEARQSAMKTYDISNLEYNKLNGLSKEELLDYLGSDEKIEQLSSSLNLSTSETSSLINTLIENKNTLEENNASIDALSQSIDLLNPNGMANVTSKIPYAINQARVRELKEGLDKGTRYYDNSTYQDLMSYYAKKYDLGDWRALLKAQGADGGENSKQLAILYGLTQGITDFEQSINKFEKMADRGFLGIASFERGRLEQEIATTVATEEAQDEAEEKFQEETERNRNILNKVFNRKLDDLTKEEFEALQKDNFVLFRQLFKKYGEGNEEIFEALSSYISENDERTAIIYGVVKQAQQAEKNKKDLGLSYDETFANAPNVAPKAFAKQFSELPTTLDALGEELKIKLKEILSTFISQVPADISQNSRAKFADTIRQMYFMQGEEGAKVYSEFVLNALKNIKPEETEDFFKMIFDNFDPSDLDWIEKLNSALKLKFGNLNWIDTFTNQMKDLGEATRHVDLKTLTEQIVDFANTLKSIKLGDFKNIFTKDQYEKMLKQGFTTEDFVMNVEGSFSLKGGADAYQEGMGNYFKNMTDETHKAIVDSFEKYEQFNNLGSKDDFEREIKYRNTEGMPSNIAEQYKEDIISDNLEDLRNFIIENADRIGRPVNDIANAEEEDLKKWLQELINQRDEYKAVVDSSEYKNRQILLEQQFSTGHLSSSQHLFNNGIFNKDVAWGLYNNLLGDENIDKSKVEKLREYIDIMEKGGSEAEAVKEDFKELASELGAHSALSKSYSTISKSMSNITQKLAILDDGVVDSLSEVKSVEEALNGLGITLPNVYDELSDLDKMQFTQSYAEMLNAFSQGSEEAYNYIIELITMSSEGGLTALAELQTESLNEWSEYATELAYILQNAGMGTIMDNVFKFWSGEDLAKMAKDNGKGKDKEVNPWENPYDWLWNITEQINKTLYQRERLERKYKLAVDDTTKSAEDLYDISKKELSNLEEQARLQSLKGQKATEEAQLLLSHYKEYAKYVSMNPLTGQVQVAYEELDKKGWSQEQGSAFEAFVSRLTELASEIKDSNTTLEEIEDEVKEIQNRGRDELIALQNRVKDALVTERQREIDTLQEVNDAISNQQSKLLEAMQQEIEETRRIRENTDKQEEIEKKRQRLSYLQRDTSGANQTEILGLQEEIENDTISYHDSLIDQSLQKMQEDNELAAEKRQEQVDIMNNQLARWTESGEIWNTVGPLLEEYFGGDNGNLQGIISNAENWQALTALEKADLEDELYNNGQLAKLFNEGDLYKAADGTRGIVQSYTNTMAEKITKAGVLGNEVLDKGNYLKVTLKDFTPKVDDTNSKLGSLNSSVNAIYQWLQKIKLTESGGNLANATQGLKALATAGTTATANSIKTEYQSAVEDFVSLATGSASLGKEEAINKVSDAIQMNKDLANYLRNEYHTENFDLVAKNLLTHAHYKGFSTGGLVTETGPAWLHGTPSKPEYVLNAKQTDMLFESLDNTNKLSKDGSQSSGGDNYFNVTVNVDEIANDYDVDKAIARVKQSIIEDSNYRNVNFISGFTY